jgi:hypothetical protein
MKALKTNKNNIEINKTITTKFLTMKFYNINIQKVDGHIINIV